MIQNVSFSVMVRAALAVVLVAAVGAAPAQTAEPLYEVEVVVFRQSEPDGADAEWHPLDPPPPQASQVVSLRRDTAGVAPYTALGSAELQLGGVVQGLKQSRRYEPLLHVGWRQPGLSESHAAAVAVPGEWQPWSGADAPPLHGLIRFYKERYLHVAVDLRYRRQDPDTVEPATYVHAQSRRLRGDELHYLDHPVLGVLVQVRLAGAER